MLDQLQKHYGPLRRTGVIYNGRDERDYRPAAKRDVVLAVGRLWDEAKNISALSRIAADVPWPILVAGDARSPDGTPAGETSGLQMLGVLDERAVAARMATAGIYASPARYEPFGLSVLEAALSGCCLVLGDIPSLREIWGDTAVYVPPDEVDALRAAVVGLIQSPERRAVLATRSRARAARYTTAAMADGYLGLYERLIEEAARVDKASAGQSVGQGDLCAS